MSESKAMKKFRERSLGNGEGCYLCAVSLAKDTTTVDHVVPKSHGGDSSPENLRICCRPCNQKKAAWERNRLKKGKPITRKDVKALR